MRWIRGRGLRTCWGCDLGMGVLRLGGFMIPKYFLRGWSFLRIRLWEKLMADSFNPATSPQYVEISATVSDAFGVTTQSK